MEPDEALAVTRDIDRALLGPFEATALDTLTSEVESLRAAVARVRAFSVDHQVPAVHGDYAQGYQAARRDILSALDMEVT
jgi:hypothetical protein